MQFSLKKLILFYIISFTSICICAQQNNYSFISKKDTVNIYKEMLNDATDDLMENHPADDIYSNIWTAEKLNPYKIPIDSLPDSVLIDCSDFHIPVRGKVTSDFGPRRYRYHYGTDLQLNIGDSVASVFSGKVRIIDYESRGYGNYVVVRHNNGLETVYAHLTKVLVLLDQEVSSGDIIALGGNTGRSTGPHLHFEIRYIGNAINPASMINFNTGKLHNENYLITKKNSFFYVQRTTKKAQTVTKYYKVRNGDTLGQIAARNGVSIKSLCKLNRINQKKILQPGQKLRVK